MLNAYILALSDFDPYLKSWGHYCGAHILKTPKVSSLAWHQLKMESAYPKGLECEENNSICLKTTLRNITKDQS